MMTRSFYPQAPNMPAVVGGSMNEMLAGLQTTLKRKAPDVLESLQPGLADVDILKIEQRGGFRLSEDMKTLYKWHNGAREWASSKKTGSIITAMGPIPGCRFVPLDEAIEQNELLWGSQSGTPVQRLALSFFAGHRRSWITVFDDGAGDGYFYDPKRTESEGAVFYCFAETRTYTFFPSVKNLIAWATKCYELDVFKSQDGSGTSNLNAAIRQSLDLQKEFGRDVS